MEEYTLIQYGHGKVDRVGEGTQILFFATPSYFISSEQEKQTLRLSHRWILPNPHPPRPYFLLILNIHYFSIFS